jgi:phage repressor protein C with HTH and peptisase S24 domain
MSKKQFALFLERLQEATPITSQASLAKALNLSRSAITQQSKKNHVPKKWISKLSERYDLNPDWLENGNPTTSPGQDNFHNKFIEVPKVPARLSAGYGSFETEPEFIEFYSFRKDWLDKKGSAKDMVLMDIAGNSMEPEMKEGDTVLIDQSQKAVLAGAIYALGLDDTIVVKRIEKRPNKMVLISENNSYPAITFEREEMNDVRIIGKVIWICRELN